MVLKDREIEKAACFKIGKFGNQTLDEADLEKIEEMNISNRKFSGEEKNVNLQELSLFPNIKRLSLQYFTIDDSVAETLNLLDRLETLQLSSCRITSNAQIGNISLKGLYLNCCDIKSYNGLCVPEFLSVIGVDNFRIDKLHGKEHIEKMYLQNCTVKGFKTIEDCNSLRSLNLDGSKVDDNRKLDELKRRIPVSHLDEYMPIR